MIGLLKGNLFIKGNDGFVIIMVGGVGYRVDASSRLLAQNEGDEILAYIYTHVREDAIKLFGFADEEELKIFEMLLSVSGIGPKGAMSIVSTLGVDGVIEAVSIEEPKAFKSVSGIGTKNAEKIVIELKGKIGKVDKSRDGVKAVSGTFRNKAELESALLSLGYSNNEIKEIIPQVEYSENISEMVKIALKLLNRK